MACVGVRHRTHGADRAIRFDGSNRRAETGPASFFLTAVIRSLELCSRVAIQGHDISVRPECLPLMSIDVVVRQDPCPLLSARCLKRDRRPTRL